MAVTSPRIWYPYGGEQPAYDLEKVERWEPVLVSAPATPDRVRVHLLSSAVGYVEFDKEDFEAAYQAYIDTVYP